MKTPRHLMAAMLLACAVFSTGCEITGPRVKVEPPKVRVPGVEVEASAPGRHCPPGQAKKGRC